MELGREEESRRMWDGGNPKILNFTKNLSSDGKMLKNMSKTSNLIVQTTFAKQNIFMVKMPLSMKSVGGVEEKRESTIHKFSCPGYLQLLRQF